MHCFDKTREIFQLLLLPGGIFQYVVLACSVSKGGYYQVCFVLEDRDSGIKVILKITLKKKVGIIMGKIVSWPF